MDMKQRSEAARRLIVLWELKEYEQFVETLRGNPDLEPKELETCDQMLKTVAYIFTRSGSRISTMREWSGTLPYSIYRRMYLSSGIGEGND